MSNQLLNLLRHAPLDVEAQWDEPTAVASEAGPTRRSAPGARGAARAPHLGVATGRAAARGRNSHHEAPPCSGIEQWAS